MPTIVVDVMPKAELLDPQGKAVGGALARLGVDIVDGVRIGKRFELTVNGEVDAAVLARIEQVAADVLSNSVIENVVGIEVLP
ncbi:phosphoribosylformylglycinamidine synthase subunit PurS [Microbacterium sp. X-17]|uniref:phosphoribosylformylglycinamidine synthase subunit PurS n=1 Tax=Microbacterium sp. X-17 TaxID=3144404 RepID=UPI0031F49C34